VGNGGTPRFSGRPELAQECTVNIDEAGIAFNGPISRAQWTWAAFIKSIEAEHIFLAYLSPCAFVILPKRLLESGQSNELRELLSRNLPTK
jgi:YcxB-like protein